VLDQLALAELIRSGGYDRHVRRMRLRYRRRRDLLLGELRRRVPAVSVGGTAAGLNLHVLLRDAAHEREQLDAARRAGVALEGFVAGRYPHRVGDESRAGLLIGYAASPEHGFAAAAEAVVELLSRPRA
jgi:GntR family transcriptional regulator/MocR family aminotransferase